MISPIATCRPVKMETPAQKEQALEEIADLFERAFETASLINLDANRYRGLNENLGSAQRKFRPASTSVR